jgi:hypothetical protein
VTTELEHAVTIVDPKTLRVVGTVPTGQAESHMLAISHDGRRGYTSNVGPGTVSVLDLEKRKLLAIIPVSENAQRISISRDDRWVFTADQTKPQAGGDRSEDHAGGADDRCSGGAAGGADAAGWTAGVCVVRRDRPGGGDRPGRVEGGAADPDRQPVRWHGVGSGAVA